jgi:uncharacterized protein with HEPN domain
VKSSDATDLDRCELILELIAHVERRLGSKSEAEFLNDKDEIDLTAFRLSAIGETSNKLSAALRERHPGIYAMRNIIAHDYSTLEAALVWRAATERLIHLKSVCATEIGRRSQ